VINKNIFEENLDGEIENKDTEDEKNYFHSGKIHRKPISISACNSLINSTRNLNNLNKQFTFNNQIIQDAANVMKNISEANYSYASKQGKIN
jgi:hypothetical protein